MKLAEAIKILDNEDDTFPKYFVKDRRKAIKLGIEAMKYHLYRRSEVDAVGSPLLPGEDKE